MLQRGCDEPVIMDGEPEHLRVRVEWYQLVLRDPAAVQLDPQPADGPFPAGRP